MRTLSPSSPEPPSVPANVDLRPAALRILAYLENRLPDYPYDPTIDRPFVAELLEDFPHLDILEQLKALRWYHDNQPPTTNHPRLAIRRWLLNSFKR